MSAACIASTTPGGTYSPFLTYYDNAHTPPGNSLGTSGPALSGVDLGLYVQDNPVVDSAPILQNHNGSAAYTEGGAAVQIDPALSVFDSELSSLNNGSGNFSGASISIGGMGGDNEIYSGHFGTRKVSGGIFLSGKARCALRCGAIGSATQRRRAEKAP